jgi:glycosyltransferase involved in cell wall biosynthesis
MLRFPRPNGKRAGSGCAMEGRGFWLYYRGTMEASSSPEPGHSPSPALARRWSILRQRVLDSLLHNARLRHACAIAVLWKARLARVLGKEPLDAAVDGVKAARLAAFDSGTQVAAEALVRDCATQKPYGLVAWERYSPEYGVDGIQLGVVLKAPAGPNEKGVVLIGFEYQWARLLRSAHLAEFAANFELVLSPTWSPPHAMMTAVFPYHYPGERIFTLISGEEDRAIFPRLSGKYRVVPLLASNWVNPSFYEPAASSAKDVDIVMLANFSSYKRHFALFSALKEAPSRMVACLAGRPWGGITADQMWKMARSYGVADRIEIIEGASDAQVRNLLARAKVSVILSRQEGSCIAVAESLFAGTPVGLLADARVGSKAFLNERTGMLLKHRGMGRQLADFVASAGRFQPREWALEHEISCFGSTRILNEILRQEQVRQGLPWTVDIAVHHWSPEPRLTRAEDRERLRPTYNYLRERLGISIVEGVS